MHILAWLVQLAADMGGVAVLAAMQGTADPETPPATASLRQRLLDFIRRRPGVRLSTLWRNLGADRGTAKYHLLLLERAHQIDAVRTKRLTRYFPSGTGAEQRVALALLRHGRVREVAQVVAQRPGVAQHEITDALPISRKVFRRYANLLIACKLLQEIREENELHYFATPHLQQVMADLEREESPEPRNDSSAPEGFP